AAALYRRLDHLAQPAVFPAGGTAMVVRRRRPRVHRAPPDLGHDAVRGGARWRLCGAALSIEDDAEYPGFRGFRAGRKRYGPRRGAAVAILGRVEALRTMPAAALAVGRRGGDFAGRTA